MAKLICVYPNIDGIGCDDLDACTQTDTCFGGVCVGSDPIICDDTTMSVLTRAPALTAFVNTPLTKPKTVMTRMHAH